MSLNNKCVVCGDVAVGIFYSASTCHSCKVFFYRNDSKIFKCSSDNNCTIDINTRSKCKSCRLQKCFSKGMAKMGNIRQSDQIVTLPKEIHSLRPMLEFNSDIENFSFTSEMTKFIKMQNSNSPYVLSGYEFDQIARLQNAIEHAFENERNVECCGEVSNHDAIAKLFWPDMYARRTVNFCKNMIEFRLLNPEYQLLVLRKFILNLVTIWAAFLWESESNGYLMIEQSGKQTYLVRFDQNSSMYHTPNGQKLFRENLKFFNDLNVEMENDFIIRDLLLGQLLFYPREDVSNHEFIKYQHYLYTHLLKRYLMHKYRNTEKETKKFKTLMELMGKLTSVKNNCQVLMQELCVRQFPELAFEMFE